MQIQTAFAADPVFPDRCIEARQTRRNMGLGRGRMVEMIDDGPSVDQFAAASEMVQPDPQIGILPDAPSRVVLIEPVDCLEILSPGGQVASDDPAKGGVTEDQGHREADSFCAAMDPSEKPPKEKGKATGPDRGDPGLLDEAPSALDPEARLGNRRVVGDKPGVGKAIPVGEDEVVSGGFEDSLVENHRLSKALVGMPQVTDWEPRILGSGRQRLACGGAGSVVRHQHLVRRAALPGQTRQDLKKSVRTVVSADHDGKSRFQEEGFEAEGEWEAGPASPRRIG